MTKVENNKAWFLVIPVFAIVAFSAIIPIMTVVNYSVQDIFGPDSRYFVGTEWFARVMTDSDLHEALLRQIIFSGTILLIEIPLGIAVALMMPTKGRAASLSLILIAIPLLIPWNVVGTIWQIFGRADIGLLGASLDGLGIDYNYASNPRDAWLTVVLMDVWHWTPLVALLCYSGLRAIPEVYYQAAQRSYSGENYSQALQQFDEFLQRYPGSELSANAQFWKAKSHLKLGQYQDSISEFQRLINSHPNDTKVPYAIHNQAVAHSNLGQINEAIRLMQRVVDEYPISPAADQARADLRQLRGN